MVTALERSDLDPSLVILEITETTIMRDTETSIECLRTLKDIGVRISIDDFGTGYSSLAYLRQFPVDQLKIDKSFVDALGVDQGGTEIVAAVVKLAHALGLQVIAEGVETERQLDVLRRLDCDLAQGYYFHRPQSPEYIEILLREARDARREQVLRKVQPA